MNKLFYILLGAIYFPCALIWSVIYGMLAGFIFKVIATWEDFFVISSREIRQWKRYSKRAYDRYINEKVAAEEVKFYERQLIRENIKKKNTHQPFPAYSIFINFVVALIVMLFRGLAGLVEGPFIVFSDLRNYWNIQILKGDPGKYYQELLIKIDLEKG